MTKWFWSTAKSEQQSDTGGASTFAEAAIFVEIVCTVIQKYFDIFGDTYEILCQLTWLLCKYYSDYHH